MSTTPKITLTYFGLAGRAEPLRVLCAIGKIPFTNKAIDFKDWPNVKKSMPLRTLPIMELEEPGKPKETIVQSRAIGRYLGKLAGWYPEDPFMAMKVDSYLDTMAEMELPVIISMGPTNYLISDEKFTPEQFAAMRERIATSEDRGFPFFCSYFENILKENAESGYLVGDKPTIADLFFAHFCGWFFSGLLDGIPTNFLDEKYPLIKAHTAKIMSLPEVVAYKEQYKQPYTDFEYIPK